MSGHGHGHGEKDHGEIKNSEGRLNPSHSMIVFPALTTPALLRKGFPLDIVVVGDEMLKKRFEAESALKPGEASGPEFMRYCHGHLSLVLWRGRSSKQPPEQENQEEGSEGDAPPANGDDEIPPSDTGHVWLRNLKDLTSFKNMIYNLNQHEGPLSKHRIGKCQGYFLGEIPEYPQDMLLALGGEEKLQLGIVSADALKLYRKHQLYWLFHLRFEEIENQVAGMCELIWTCARVHKENNSPDNICHYIPADEVLLPEFTKEVVKGGEKGQRGISQNLLKPIAKSTEESQLFDYGEKQRREHSYTLLSPGKSYLTPKDKSEPPPDTSYVAAMRQDGHLYGPRHPVYVDAKEKLSTGVVADPHLSSRQALYKLLGARVIPGVEQEPVSGSSTGLQSHIENPSPADSPLIGCTAHENLQSTVKLMRDVAERSDIIAYLGDMYDHICNLDPRVYVGSAGKDMRRTGKFWSFMKYKEIYKEKDYATYPRLIDATIGLNLIYDLYSKGSPVIFIVGNHEAYEHAYGISPRVLINAIRGNEGIPMDHNLTYYEAILLYGPTFGETEGVEIDVQHAEPLYPYTIDADYGDETASMQIGLFRKENLAWLRLILSPWKDIYLRYGDKQDMLFLDWGLDEMYLPNLPFGDTLPVAKGTVTSDQLSLVEQLSAQGGGGRTTILASHFTQAAYTSTLPLFGQKYAKPGLFVTSGNPDSEPGTHERDPIPGHAREIGTYYPKSGVWPKLLDGTITYTLSGHTHRAGLYEAGTWEEFEDVDEMTGQSSVTVTENISSLRAHGVESMRKIRLGNRSGKNAALLVSGSCGTYNKQNFFGEFNGRGMDRPQAMILNLKSDGDSVDMLPSASPLPRLAVVLDYLWFDKLPLFTGWASYKGKNYQICCGDDSTYYSVGINKQLMSFFAAKPGGPAPDYPPIKEIKLHAVDTIGGIHGGCLTMRPLPYSTQVYFEEQNRLMLNVTPEEVKFFVEKHLSTMNIMNPLFFISVHFHLTKFYFQEYYDTSSPWCFPASCDKIQSNLNRYYVIGRGSGSGGSGNEYPDFDNLNDTDEYRSK